MNDFFDNIENVAVEEHVVDKKWDYVLTINSAMYTQPQRYILDEDITMIKRVMTRDLKSLVFVDDGLMIEVGEPKIFSESVSYVYFSVPVLIKGTFKCMRDFVVFLITMDVWYNHRNFPYTPGSYMYNTYSLSEYGYSSDDEEHSTTDVELECPLKCLNQYYNINNSEYYDLMMKCITDMCKFIGFKNSDGNAYSEIRHILRLYDKGVVNSVLANHNKILYSYVQKSSKYSLRNINMVDIADCPEANFLKKYNQQSPILADLSSLKAMIENPPEDVWTTLGISNYQKCITANYLPNGLYNLKDYNNEKEIKSLLDNIEQITKKPHEIITKTFFNTRAKDVYFICQCGEVYLPNLDICAIVTYGIYGKFEQVKKAIEKLL